MSYELTVNPFDMGTPKESAVKVLEEAAESFGEWQKLDAFMNDTGTAYGDSNHAYQLNIICLADELADVIQAACNLADRYGIDLAAAMERCEERNRARGRYE